MSKAIELEMKAGDIERNLQPFHREVMIDLILTWASLDGALGMLAGRFLGVPMHTAAEEIGRLGGSAKLAKIISILSRVDRGETLAGILRKHKDNYEKFSRQRNRIAHAHCAGCLRSDNNYVVFAVFEKEGDDQLAIEAIPLEEMQRATRWGRAFLSWVCELLMQPNPCSVPDVV